MLHTIFFDLDNTLYPRECGIWDAIGARIDLYIKSKLDIDDNKVQDIRSYCRMNYGTSLEGLKSLFDIDENEYLNFVHDVDLSKMLPNGKKLQNLLESIPQRKIIFTNSDLHHASRVLDTLGVQPHFECVVDILATSPYVKPDHKAFQKALDLAGLRSPEGCVFVDDMIENIEQAQVLGFLSILVGDSAEGYRSIPDIYSLPDLLSSL